MLVSINAPRRTSPVRRGRPRNADLTQKLLRQAGDLVSCLGIDAVGTTDVTTAANAGKASLYRRWPGGMADLRLDVLTTCRVVPSPDPTVPAVVQIRALLTSWTTPLTRDEQIVASTLGAIGADLPLRRLVLARIDGDLAAWWGHLHPLAEGAASSPAPLTLRMLRAMLVTRLISGPLTPELSAQLERLIGLVDTGDEHVVQE